MDIQYLLAYEGQSFFSIHFHEILEVSQKRKRKGLRQTECLIMTKDVSQIWIKKADLSGLFQVN